MEQKHRSRISRKGTWDLYQDRGFLACVKTRRGYRRWQITRAIFILLRFRPLRNWEQIYIQMSHIGSITPLSQTTDYSNEDFATLSWDKFETVPA